VRLAALVATLSALAAAAPAGQGSGYNPDWNRPATPHRIMGNVYFVGTNELGIFLVTTPRGHILIDPGFDETVPLIRESMRTLGFAYEDIRVLLTTQAHYDHASGIARIRRETGAWVEAMREDAPLLEAGGRGDFLFGNDYTFPPVTVDRVLMDRDVVEQGGVRLTARRTPGHTKGSTTFTTVVSEQGWSYPMAFAASTTVNAGTPLVGNTRYPDIVEDWQRTYAVLEALSPWVWVSSHNSFYDMAGKLARIGKGENPYIDPRGYRRYVANGRQRFTALLADEIAGASKPGDKSQKAGDSRKTEAATRRQSDRGTGGGVGVRPERSTR
jgi:metallo-beta-lactamase class B